MSCIKRLGAALAVAFLFAAFTAPSGYADGSVTMRGAYYKETSTRVVQPMLDAALDVGDNGQLQAHTLVDAITSASAGSGSNGQPFTENRTEVGANYLHDFRTVRLGGGLRHSSESDYKSDFVTLRLESDFAQRNTTVGINLARGKDSLDNSGSQGGISALLTGELDTTMVSASLSQILSPKSIASLSYDLSYLDGFQQNIYRTVVAGGMVQPERVPGTRLRHALAGSLRYYVAYTKTVVAGSYRVYKDDWGILANTPEVRAIQEFAGGDLDVHLSYRYHRQRAAEFYKEVYDSADINVQPFATDDDKLGKVRSHATALKLGVNLALFGVEGKWSGVRIEALGRYIVQNTHYGNAIVSQLALVIPVEY